MDIDRAARALDRRAARAMGEMHDDLRVAVEELVRRLSGRLRPWQAHRPREEQGRVWLFGRRVVGETLDVEVFVAACLGGDGATCRDMIERGEVTVRKTGPTRTNALPGESPHNYLPALACDLVLDPRAVLVAPHPEDRTVPWLWDAASTDARTAWADLDREAKALGLARIEWDRPHVELPTWRAHLPRSLSEE